MFLSTISQLNSLRAAVPTAFLLGVSPTFFMVHTSWKMVSYVLPKKWFYIVEDSIWGWYQKFVVFVFEACTGVEVVVKGSIPRKVENAVMICNHQTAMDWIVTDFLALRQGMIGHMRFVFKDVLKYFPLYGYVWGVHGGIFVRRDGTYNSMKMKETLKMLMDRDVPVYLVIYPEGTRFCPGKESLLAKSQAYASQNDLEPLNQVLTPRVKAFYCAVSSMKKYLDAVYDATIIYENKYEADGAKTRHLAPSMWDVLSGKCKRIYIEFERIPARDIPINTASETSTFKWLHMRFKHKDNILTQYYSLTSEKNSTESNEAQKFLKDDYQLTSPVKYTIAASASIVGLTIFLLSTSTGRMIYAFTAIGGTVFGWIYSYMLF